MVGRGSAVNWRDDTNCSAIGAVTAAIYQRRPAAGMTSHARADQVRATGTELLPTSRDFARLRETRETHSFARSLAPDFRNADEQYHCTLPPYAGLVV